MDESGIAGPQQWGLEWGLWNTPAADGVRNMAVDAALLAHARHTGRAVWRSYAWSAPTLSFGRNEVTRGRFDAASVARAGFDVVRRPTGGRALLHAREITYSVAFPIADDVPWRTAYRWVNRQLQAALITLGVDATIAGDGAERSASAVTPDGPLCFDMPAEGELVVGGRKLAGSAVWRERGAFLQHGSILLADDQARIALAAIGQVPSPPPAAALLALRPDLASHSDESVATLVASRIGRILSESVPVRDFAPTPALLADVDRFESLYRSPSWLWRR